MKKIFFISILTIFLTNCKVENLPVLPQGKGVITGLVNIPFVKVTAINENGMYTDTTDSNGRYTLSKIARGTYNLLFEKQGYFTSSIKGVESNGIDTVRFYKKYQQNKEESQFYILKIKNIYLDEFEIVEFNNIITITSLKFHASNLDTNAIYIRPYLEFCKDKHFDTNLTKVYVSYFDFRSTLGFNEKVALNNFTISQHYQNTYYKTGDTVFVRPIINSYFQKNNIVKFYIKK